MKIKISWLPIPKGLEIRHTVIAALQVSSCNSWYLDFFLDTLNPFYITYSISVYFVTLLKFVKNLQHRSFLFRLILLSWIQRADTQPSSLLLILSDLMWRVSADVIRI